MGRKAMKLRMRKASADEAKQLVNGWEGWEDKECEIEEEQAESNGGEKGQGEEADGNADADGWAPALACDELEARKEPLVRALLSQQATPGHITGLEQLFCDSVRTVERDADLEALVEQIVDALQTYLDELFGKRNYVLKVFGSFLTGLYDREEQIHDLNICIDYAEAYRGERTVGSLFDELYAALIKAPEKITFLDANTTMLSGWIVPAISFSAFFNEHAIQVMCCIGQQAHTVLLSSRVLLAYTTLNPAVKQLAMFVRKWAKILRLNAPVLGGFPNYLMDLLVVCYLQQRNLLPFIDEFLDTELDIVPLNILAEMPATPLRFFCETYILPRLAHYGEDGEETPSIGALIKGFFQYFALDYDPSTVCRVTRVCTTEGRNFSHSQLVVRDPMTGWNVARMRLDIYYEFMNSLLVTACSYCIPQTHEGPVHRIVFNSQGRKPSHLTLQKQEVHSAFLSTLQALLKPYYEASDYVPIYSMQRSALTPNCKVIPQVFCGICGRGHREVDCTRANIQLPLGPFQQLGETFNQELCSAIESLYEKKVMTEERLDTINQFMKRIETLLKCELSEPELTLTAFGSLANGFGHDECDLDLCLRVGEDGQIIYGDPAAAKELLMHILELLKDQMSSVELVLTARVPIVKFTSEASELMKGDISVYNTLALENTRLLKAYADFDPRVPLLGMAIKHWARLFRINDASEGSISSYAYIIMLIAYLQRCDPPVLPCLQEGISPDAERTKVDRWDVTFRERANKIVPPNKKTLSELFFGFFRHYANFDFDQRVVQVRITRKQLSKLDKEWHLMRMCVEDPFELEHNLTSGVKLSGLAYFTQCLGNTVRGLDLIDRERMEKMRRGCPTEEFTLGMLGRFIPEMPSTTRRKGGGGRGSAIRPSIKPADKNGE